MATFAVNTKAKTTTGTLPGTLEFDTGNALKHIDLPCLIIPSKDDRLIDPKAGPQQQKLIKGSKLVVVNGGHQSLAEYPEETNDALEKFLNKHNI